MKTKPTEYSFFFLLTLSFTSYGSRWSSGTPEPQVETMERRKHSTSMICSCRLPHDVPANAYTAALAEAKQALDRLVSSRQRDSHSVHAKGGVKPQLVSTQGAPAHQ